MPSFGTGGIVTTVIPGTTRSTAYAIAIEADGRLLLAGQGMYFSGTAKRNEIVLVRFNADGTLDSGSGSVTRSTMAATVAHDILLATLVLDSPDPWDGPPLEKRLHST